jgi:hypothetical protein
MFIMLASAPRPCLAPCLLSVLSHVASKNWNKPVADEVLASALGLSELSRTAVVSKKLKSAPVALDAFAMACLTGDPPIASGVML